MALVLTGSIVALVTPMTPAGEVDFVAWDRLLDWHHAEGTDGVVVAGTTGESATLTEAEAEQLVKRAKARFVGRAVLAGSGTNSTASTISRSLALAAAGADALLVVAPYYNKPTQAGLVAHFRAVARAVPIPVVIYNVPGRTAVDIRPEAIDELADEPNIVAVKESTMSVERIAQLLARASDRLTVLCGDDPVAAESMLAGARGVISVTANVAPGQMHEMASAALAGDAVRARGIDASLRALHEALFVESNPIPTKWALAELGLIGPGIRLPLTPLSAAAQPIVREALAQLTRSHAA
jgi:4-hydroxy-tetrahydrodipicolinate synthase